MDDKLGDIRRLRGLLDSCFGARVQVLAVDRAESQITFVLYDAVTFTAGFDAPNRNFGLVLHLPGGVTLRRFLGAEASLGNDDDSILRGLELADRYCRLRLPETFLHEFDTTIREG